MHFLNFLGELTVRALVLGAIGTTAVWAIRRSSADRHHAIWRLVLMGMMVLPLLMLLLPPLSLLPTRATTIAENVVTSIQYSSYIPTSLGGDKVSPGAPISEFPEPRPRRLWPTIYVAIAGLFLLRTIRAVARAKRLARESRPIRRSSVGIAHLRHELRESDAVKIPFTVGWSDPVIVLPEGWRLWDQFKLRSVLSHEIAHIRRADWVTSVVAGLNRSVFWFHPLAWWVERRLNSLAEDACDESAIRSTGDPLRYAKVVLEFARVAAARQQPVMGTAMARTSDVCRRVGRIMDGRVAVKSGITGFAGVMMVLLAAPIMYGVAALELIPEARQLQSGRSAYTIEEHRDLHQELLRDGWNLKPDEVAKLESQLASNPQHLDARRKLLSYYTQQVIAEPRATYLLWLIEHHPDADIFRLGSVVTDTFSDYTALNTPQTKERARTLWLNHVERFPTNTRILSNAALAFSSADARISLDLVKRARAVEPNEAHWANWLGSVYARAVRTVFAGGLLGFSGRSTVPNTWFPMLPLRLPESEILKSELETSTDAVLLRATGETLVRETEALEPFIRERGGDHMASRLAEAAAGLAYGKRLLSRAQELDAKKPAGNN